jgi:hypothetical protein
MQFGLLQHHAWPVLISWVWVLQTHQSPLALHFAYHLVGQLALYFRHNIFLRELDVLRVLRTSMLVKVSSRAIEILEEIT